MNCKLGGTLWKVQIPLQNTMIVGIDTYHEGANRNKSVGGLVASLNSTFTRYYSRPHINEGAKEELGSGLIHCFVESLEMFKEVNHQLPQKIIIYRDGKSLNFYSFSVA